MSYLRWLAVIALLLTVLAGCPAPEEPATIVVKNDSTTYTVDNLLVYPAGSTDYGANRLGSDTIAPSGQFTLTGIAAGTYDMFASEPSDGWWENLNVTLSAGESSTWTLTDATYHSP